MDISGRIMQIPINHNDISNVRIDIVTGIPLVNGYIFISGQYTIYRQYTKILFLHPDGKWYPGMSKFNGDLSGYFKSSQAAVELLSSMNIPFIVCDELDQECTKRINNKPVEESEEFIRTIYFD